MNGFNASNSLHTGGVTGSIPVAPTTEKHYVPARGLVAAINSSTAGRRSTKLHDVRSWLAPATKAGAVPRRPALGGRCKRAPGRAPVACSGSRRAPKR
jgi:hypothetical protein